MNTLMDAAMEYRAKGLHPIPCLPREKRPMVDWKLYQTEPPLQDEIAVWWTKHPDANVALVLGRGLFAVDFDGPLAETLLRGRGIEWPGDAPRSRTSKGHHVILSANREVPDRVALLKGDAPDGRTGQVDIRGRGIIVAPPSVHPSGHVYTWEVPLVLPVPPAPPELLCLIEERGPHSPYGKGDHDDDWYERVCDGVPEGQRDATAARLAGYWLHATSGNEEATFRAMRLWATRCDPPFPDPEVRKVVRSIARREAAASRWSTPTTTHVGQVLDGVWTALKTGMPTFVQTPFASLNHSLCGGLASGELTYIGARPGVGKTAFGLELTRGAAKRGVGVLFVSKEMVLTALGRRMVSQEGKVSASGLRRHVLSSEDLAKTEAAMYKLRDLPIWMTDSATTVQQIATLVEGHRTTPPVGLVVVDYLQLIHGEGEDRRLQVESVSRELKALAMRCKLPVVCLSSLARPGSGGEARPTLGSLRESGALEHDADFVILLHRKMGDELCEAIVAKARDGMTGTVELRFRSEYVTFDENGTNA